MQLRRIAWMLPRAVMSLAALVATGCSSSPGENILLPYGCPPPTLPPAVSILDFSYQPEGMISTRDGELTFEITVDQPFRNRLLTAEVWIGSADHPFQPGSVGAYVIHGRDDGIPPDRVANDLIYSGRTDMLGSGSRTGLPVCAHIDWRSGCIISSSQGEPLDIIDPEDNE